MTLEWVKHTSLSLMLSVAVEFMVVSRTLVEVAVASSELRP